ncbi:MAG: sulfite exporter TauE/SafE family protein [Nocardioidaceae bacterium]|nr:sulfite exporter TauE/SafE family protein [Nocardioidaceae bacterium]
MSLGEAFLVLAAGLAAGTINTVVGSGTLITFPTLLAIGLDPVAANVSNTIGLVPGSLSGAVGYRRELSGQRSRLLRLAPAATAGGLVGAVLLLVLPDDAFDAIVPALIGVGCVLVAVQPWLTRLLGRDGREERPPHGSVLVVVLIFLTGVYGGYFGAAQGVLLIAIMGLLLDAHLQRVNAVKNVLALLVNGVAAVVFVVIADPDWAVVGLIALGASVGGQIGATVGRRLPPVAFRVFIVVVGVVAIWRLLA